MPQAAGLAILDPFPHIAMHIVEPELVRFERSHRSRVAESVLAGGHDPIRKGSAGGLIRAVAVFADAGIFVPVCKARCRSAAGSIFPLRLGQKPVRVAGLRAKPLNIGVSIFPTDAGDRMA